MPQVHLPIFPEGSSDINDHLAFEKRAGQVTYFYGTHPVFTHAEADLQSFRMYTSQLIVNGSAKGAQIQRAFGLPAVTVKRYVKQFREKGIASFFAPKVHRGPAVLTDEVIKKAQALLDEGLSRRDVAQRIEVKLDTFTKAIRAGRLHELKKKVPVPASQQ
jgi:transposase